MKNKFKFTALIVLFLNLFTQVRCTLVLTESNTVNGTDSVLFLIESGVKLSDIVDLLTSEDILLENDRRIFTRYIIETGIDRNVRWGYYYFYKPTNPESLVEILRKGPVLNLVTIQEGLTVEQVASILKYKASCDSGEFVTLCYESAFIAEVLGKYYDNPENIKTLEGFLFPSSYDFGFGVKPSEAIGIMTVKYFQIEESLKMDNHQSDLNVYEVLILASLIEKEAKIDEERSVIASVYLNRLSKNMLLQCDATILYALGKHKEKVLLSDLEIDSPYNTYKYQGLPPGPICNPGEASLKAAWNPANTSYIYYVAKSDGRHIFSRTYQEHIRATNSVRR